MAGRCSRSQCSKPGPFGGPGTSRSANTTSTHVASRTRRASSPFAASITSKPDLRRCSVVESRSERSLCITMTTMAVVAMGPSASEDLSDIAILSSTLRDACAFGPSTSSDYHWISNKRMSTPLAQPGESIPTPILAADAVVDKEQALGIVVVLHLPQPLVVGAPEGASPIGLEVVGFRDVGPGLGDELAQLPHRGGDALGAAVCRSQ